MREMVTGVELENPLGKSEHACISFNFHCSAKHTDNERTFILYNKANYTALKTEFRCGEWIEKINLGNDVQEMYNIFLDKYNTTCNKHIPTRKSKQ